MGTRGVVMDIKRVVDEVEVRRGDTNDGEEDDD